MTAPALDTALVVALIADQFPQWDGLPVTPVPQGWDHRTFRLGDELSVRLPSAEGYVLQVEKEHRWLPRLAPGLPLPIPTPVALGIPGSGYPFPWSVYGWLHGDPAATDATLVDSALGAAMAGFLRALQALDAHDGPAPGLHSAFRGAPPAVYDPDVRRCLRLLSGRRRSRVAALWEQAIGASAAASPVWFHGDVAAGNLLIVDGRLSAVLDFGCSGVGDPACDVAAAWMLFDGDARTAYLDVLDPDPELEVRGRGWALWKALLRLEAGGADAEVGDRILDAVLG